MGIDPFDGLPMRFRRLLQDGATPEQLLAAARKISPVPDFDEYEILTSLVLGNPMEKPAVESEPLFRDAGAAADRLVRLVPAEIRELASFGNLFTDPGTWKTPVPVHYTYWS
ncbi:hypothetical protein [Arthrobacter methylotrophus]|uniref:Uncharacterized protein n=1 Tax=Arthrobacter methylotrophus TaxID=121291 RepID=A0ABV5URC6_9MICC